MRRDHSKVFKRTAIAGAAATSSVLFPLLQLLKPKVNKPKVKTETETALLLIDLNIISSKKLTTYYLLLKKLPTSYLI